jgi:hypothetical protein
MKSAWRRIAPVAPPGEILTMAQQLAKQIGVVFRGSGRAMHRDVIAMELTAEERTLLLRYGYGDGQLDEL